MLDTNQEHINMKKLLFALFAVLTLLALSSCESEPQVTACQEQTADEPEYGTDYWGNVVFRGTKKVSKGWLHWDDNKECPHQNGYTFRILKNTPTQILKSDKCDHCHFSWNLHDDK